MKYRVVEYNQSKLGEIISKVLPLGFKPSMREGEPYYCTGVINDAAAAVKARDTRMQQLVRSGNIDKVTVGIEELYG